MAETASSYADFTERLGNGIVEQIERIQDNQLSALQSIREAVERFVPALPNGFVPALPNGFVPALPNVDYSIPQAIGAANFALAEQLLAVQKKYILGLLESLAPRNSAE